MTVPVSGVSKKPLLEVGFRGEGSEQGLDSRRSPAAWLEIDTPALGPGDRSPAPSSLLPMRTALLGDFFFFFFTFSSPSSSPAPPSLAFPFGSREASAVALDRLELRAKREGKKKKSLSLKKKKKISDGSPLLPALSKLELHAGFRSPFSAFLRSEPPEGVWFSIRILLCVLCSRASLPCPKT